jgi:hypothetical protein
MKYSIQIILLSLLFSLPSNAQIFNFEKIPEWVKIIDIPDSTTVSKYDITSGYYLKLLDYQINMESNRVFNHEVRNIISYSGITNASQLSVVYDTSYQQLIIHHLIIWRKGKKLDRTSDLSLEIMNNEYNLDQGIYSGKVTAYDILNDIRKDDLIDFAYTLMGENPIFDNEKYYFIPLESSNPIDLYSIRLLYPEGKNYVYECVDCDSLNISDTSIDGLHQIEITLDNLQAIKLEENIPTWQVPYKFITISSFNAWKDVYKWGQNVFALEKEQNLDQVFEEIFTGQETTEEKINKIIDYVQDEIRYMGIESGIGSIKPFTPEQVVKQRFGDCKDKSLLLVTLLKKIGVEKAYPALVNTVMQQDVGKYFPSNQVFNHCIVTYNYNDTTYWVDPAVALQGGDFKDLYTFDYGKALIIGMPADSLHTMSPRKTVSGADIVETLSVTSFSEAASYKIVSNRYGFEADNRRAVLEYYSIKDISDNVTEDLKLQFPIVNKTSELEISDDVEKNSLVVTYNYEVDGFWQDGDKGTNEGSRGYWIYKYEPRTLYQYFSESTCEEREYDYELTYPLNLNFTIVFNFHKEMLAYDSNQIIENDAFYFEEQVEQLSRKSLKIDYTFNIKSNSIKAANYKEICEQKNAIVQELPIVIYFPK